MIASILSVLAIVILSGSSIGNVYWVDAVGGSNSNSGLSASEAWRTITHATLAAPSDAEIHILPGVYDVALGEVFPLEIESQQLIGHPEPDQPALLVGSIGLVAIQFVGINAADHAQISNLSIQMFSIALYDPRAGTVSLSGLQIADCTFGFSKEGFVVGVQVNIDNCVFDNCVGGLVFVLNNKNLTVSVRDSAFTNSARGVHLRDPAKPAGGTPQPASYTFERCIFADNAQRGLLADGGPNIVEIVDSLIVRNGQGVFHIPQTLLSIRRCTVAGNVGVGVTGADLIEDSIFWGNNDDIGFATVVTTSNIEDGDWTGNGNISVDPEFRDPVNGDYRLSLTSPCVDILQNAASPPLDLVGAVRGIDGNLDTEGLTDMGAYEFQTLEPVGEPTLGSTVQLEHRAEPDTHAVLFSALSLLPQPLLTRYGLLELDPGQTIGLARVHLSSTGIASVPFLIPDLPVLVGTAVHFQSNARSSAAPSAFALTNRVTLVVKP